MAKKIDQRGHVYFVSPYDHGQSHLPTPLQLFILLVCGQRFSQRYLVKTVPLSNKSMKIWNQFSWLNTHKCLPRKYTLTSINVWEENRFFRYSMPKSATD